MYIHLLFVESPFLNSKKHILSELPMGLSRSMDALLLFLVAVMKTGFR